MISVVAGHGQAAKWAIFTHSTEVSSSVWLIESETNGHRSVFADIFTLNFLDENCGIFIEISLKFVFNGLINIYPALSSIGSDTGNSLAPNQRQAIVLTNDGQV